MIDNDIQKVISAAISGKTVIVACIDSDHIEKAFGQTVRELDRDNIHYAAIHSNSLIRVDEANIYFRSFHRMRGMTADCILYDQIPTEYERDISMPCLIASGGTIL